MAGMGFRMLELWIIIEKSENAWKFPGQNKIDNALNNMSYMILLCL